MKVGYAIYLRSVTYFKLDLKQKTSMSVLLIVGSKCTLAVSHAALWWVTVSMPTEETVRRTDISLHYPFRWTRPV